MQIEEKNTGRPEELYLNNKNSKTPISNLTI